MLLSRQGFDRGRYRLRPRAARRRPFFAFRGSGVALRRAALCAVGLCLFGAILWAGLKRLDTRPRRISVCAVTDFYFRDQKPNWPYQLTLWFAELNRIFEPAGVHWSLAFGGEAYSPETPGSMAERRSLLEQNTDCRADVIIGFTGKPDFDAKSAASPFNRSLLVAATRDEPDALVVTTLARAMAQLFGVPVAAQTVVTPDDNGGVLDGRSLALIAALKDYNFALGVKGLSRGWEPRAEAAIEQWFAGRTEHPDMEAHRVLGRAYAEGFDLPRAITQFRAVVKEDRADTLSRLELALQLQRDGQLDEALRELQEAARWSPDDARPRAALGAWFYARGRVESAIEELRAAVRLDPHEPAYQNALGRMLSTQLGGASAAAAAFEAALRVQPRNAGVNQRLADVQSRRTVMESRLAELRAAVLASPANSIAHLQLGVALAEAGANDAAAAELERSVALQSDNGLAHMALARLRYASGDYAAARRELDSAKAAGVSPFSSFATALDRQLNP
jgi:Tfp pilus assembly protein PilF